MQSQPLELTIETNDLYFLIGFHVARGLALEKLLSQVRSASEAAPAEPVPLDRKRPQEGA